MSDFDFAGETTGERYTRQLVMGAGIALCGGCFVLGVLMAVSSMYVGSVGYLAIGLGLALGHACTVYSMAKHGLGLDAGRLFRHGGSR